ncbi:MAG: FeS-binding protein [Desulfobacterales bacterium]|jgi:hypothetical protein
MKAAALSLTHSKRQNRPMRYLYILTVFCMALTGFGQMPIYKRYYLSDIPGFSWLANFWTTRYVHYAGAALLLAIVAYLLVQHVILIRAQRKITLSGYLRGVLLLGIVLTGVLFVIKNFAVFVFSPEFIIALNLSHLGFVMIFLLVNLYCLIFKKQWTKAR